MSRYKPGIKHDVRVAAGKLSRALALFTTRFLAVAVSAAFIRFGRNPLMLKPVWEDLEVVCPLHMQEKGKGIEIIYRLLFFSLFPLPTRTRL